MKILIAVPTYENITPDTYKSIYDLDDGGHELLFEYVRGYDCASARNRIVKKAKDLGVDYVFMVDNDVTLPEDALINLLDDAKDVCLGYYAHRGPDNVYHGNTCVCRLYEPSGKKYFNYPLESQYTGDELKKFASEGKYKIQIHGGGMGCALIKMSVFKKLRYPYYNWVLYPSGGVLGEDLYFCEECRKKGIPIYADSRVGCGHLLRHVQWPTEDND